MKIRFLAVIVFFIVTSNAQTLPIGKDEYERVFQFAVEETNADYPVVFKVITTFIKNGKAVRTVTDLNENQSQGHHRIKRTVAAGGKQTNKYQVSLGFGKVFCSDDGASWKSSKYQCFGPVIVYGRREPESVEYRVATKLVKGKEVKIYREYSVFAPSDGSEKKDFNEKVSTIDSRGFLLSVEDTEGTMDPKTITLTRKQSWLTKAKIKPVVSPVK